ncbi:MAG: hypothetical protein ABEI98_05030 [Halorhabdus sp.]
MKNSDRTGLQDSGTTQIKNIALPTRIIADDEDPFAALVDQLVDATEVAA